ncbi:hypothetical protein CRENBAI_024703 [Crenichthys baileyi]|uniref:Uncharacterized protein n=1 Tax=Crenichthys baileyi TaxID=28760 RepID=A0AAV9RAE6_9TELE
MSDPARSNKVSSYLQTSSFWSSSSHIGPTRNRIMTEGNSQQDQAGGMEREFKRGEILLTMEKAGNSWQPSRLARGEEGFLDLRIHHAIEAERQRALYEIVASMRRSPAPSSTRLSTEARPCFPSHGLAPDQPSRLLPTPNPVPDPVPEGFVDEPPPHPNPVLGFVPEGFMDEPPPHPDPVSGPVPEWFMDELPPHPDPVSGPVPEGFLDEEDASSLPAIIGSYVTGLLNSYVASLLIACTYVASLLFAGSARAGRLHSGSVGDGLRAGRLNSCPPSEDPSAHPGRIFVLFLFCGRLGSASYLQTSSFRSSSPHIGPTRNPNMTDSGSGGMGSVL